MINQKVIYIICLCKLNLEVEEEEDINAIPDYMFQLIDRFQEESISYKDPTPIAKLPTIAIIGRPNTGKSTIANKLTNSFKVKCPSFMLFSNKMYIQGWSHRT